MQGKPKEWSELSSREKNVKSHRTNIKRALGKVKDGGRIRSNSSLGLLFNCKTCTWAGTLICPNGLKRGEIHSNGVCIQRLDFLKEHFKKAGGKVKYYQIEELFKMKFMSDYLAGEFFRTGKMPDGFSNLQKNLISLTDKIRRQDEGIKTISETAHTFDEFRKIVDVQAKAIADKKFKEKTAIDAEFKDEGETE